MGDRGIDRDHQIKRAHGAGGFAEVAEFLREFQHLGLAGFVFLEPVEIGGARAKLKARERHTLQRE